MFDPKAFVSRVGLIGAVIGLTLIAGAAHADQVGAITSITGSARIERNGDNLAAAKQMPIELYDRAITDAGANLVITLSDKSQVVLDESSTIVINEHVVSGGRRDNTRLRLLGGTIRSIVSPAAGGGAFEVRTPNAIAGVRGTDFEVEYNAAAASDPDAATRIAVYEGEVEAANKNDPSSPVLIGAGFQGSVIGREVPLLRRLPKGMRHPKLRLPESRIALPEAPREPALPSTGAIAPPVSAVTGGGGAALTAPAGGFGDVVKGFAGSILGEVPAAAPVENLKGAVPHVNPLGEGLPAAETIKTLPATGLPKGGVEAGAALEGAVPKSDLPRSVAPPATVPSDLPLPRRNLPRKAPSDFLP